MASAKPRSKRQRRNFSHLEKTPAARILELPNLIDIQRASFKKFMETGIREVISDISPIEDYTGTLAVEFGEHVFEPPAISERDCREKDKSFESGLFMTVSFVNKVTGEIREQRVFMGNFPQMTSAGTFIINGTERVVVTQLVRSPGAYIMEPKDPAKQVFIANLMPQRGSWLELEIDRDLTFEDRDVDLELRGLRIDLDDLAIEIGERTRRNFDHLAELELGDSLRLGLSTLDA